MNYRLDVTIVINADDPRDAEEIWEDHIAPTIEHARLVSLTSGAAELAGDE